MARLVRTHSNSLEKRSSELSHSIIAVTCFHWNRCRPLKGHRMDNRKHCMSSDRKFYLSIISVQLSVTHMVLEAISCTWVGNMEKWRGAPFQFVDESVSKYAYRVLEQEQKTQKYKRYKIFKICKYPMAIINGNLFFFSVQIFRNISEWKPSPDNKELNKKK